MKNIYILPTGNYSPLVYSTSKYGGLFLSKYYSPMKNMGDSYQNIYITSDEEIKDCWVLNIHTNQVYFVKEYYGIQPNIKKIILTTDFRISPDLQKMDDEFLEWFVKNPSCEEVEVIKVFDEDWSDIAGAFEISYYKIIIPKEESLGYICPQTKKQCDDECCVSAEDCHIKSGIGILSDSKQDEMVGIEFYKTADKVISVNKKHNMKYKTVLNISIKGEDKQKNIFKVKSKYYKLNNEEKETLLKGLLFWARQEINNLHPEQE